MKVFFLVICGGLFSIGVYGLGRGDGRDAEIRAHQIKNCEVLNGKLISVDGKEECIRKESLIILDGG